MALPCECCQEPMIVLPNGEPILDAADRTVYRRFAVCTNPDCDFYLLRRVTYEVALPLTPDVRVMSPTVAHIRNRFANLPPRTAPIPEMLLNQEHT